MKRFLYYNLLEWLINVHRKPLILFGARQVGKTHLVRMLGKQMDHFVEINLEREPETKKLFQGNLDAKLLIQQLSLVINQTIIPGKTLLFIDEIQEEPRAILALRYFYEEVPLLHVIAAGSLLDFALESIGIPVGRVTLRWLYPLSFIEFLDSLGYKQLAKAIIQQPPQNAFANPIHIKALALCSEYMAVGGMPQVVSEWRDSHDPKLCQSTQLDIISTYKNDFSKYAKKYQIKYLDLLFQKLPRYISKRFKYSFLETNHKKRELEPALYLLQKARVIHLISHSHGHAIPLGAEIDTKKSKIIMLDIALTQAILGLSIKDWFLDPAVTLSNKGEIVEAFVGQELLTYHEPFAQAALYYWQRDERGAQAEVDYLHVIENHIIPIEVKSGHNATLQSLRLFLKERQHTPYGIRISTYNYSRIDQLQNYPLYAVACLASDKTLIDKLLGDET